MTPKEKAKDIFNKMLFEIEYNCQPSIKEMIAKKCALILVKEIQHLTWMQAIYWNAVEFEIQHL